MNNPVAPLVSLLSAPQLNEALRNKLSKLINAVTNGREPKRVLRLARRLSERCVKDALTAVRNVRDVHIWQLLKDHGCVYLPNGNQDRVLLAVIREFSSQPRQQLSRPMAIERVLNQLQSERVPVQTAGSGSHRFSKTNVGHVLQLLFRSGAFVISHEESRLGLGSTTVWQLREELLDFDQLRRVHDTAIVAMAQQEGIFLSPAEWARCLYRDWRKAAHFQSILDRQRVELDALVDRLRKTHLAAIARDESSPLAKLAAVPNVREHEPSAEEVQWALLAVHQAFDILAQAHKTRQDATRPASVNAGLFSMATYFAPEDAAHGRMRSASTCAASPTVACCSPQFRAVGTRPGPGSSFAGDQWLARSRAQTQTDSHFVPILSDERSPEPRVDAPFSMGSPLLPAHRPILGRGAAPLSAASSSDELQQLVADLFGALAPNAYSANASASQPFASPLSSEPDSFCFKSFVSSLPSAAASPDWAVKGAEAGEPQLFAGLRRPRRSSSACDVSSNCEFDECMDDNIFPVAPSPIGASPGVGVPFAAFPNSPSLSVRHAPSAPLFLRTLSEDAKDDLLS